MNFIDQDLIFLNSYELSDLIHSCESWNEKLDSFVTDMRSTEVDDSEVRRHLKINRRIFIFD